MERILYFQNGIKRRHLHQVMSFRDKMLLKEGMHEFTFLTGVSK